LKALSPCGVAPSRAISAARRKLSGDAVRPASHCSASRARQGLVATPPSAIRASWIVVPRISSATATDASANANAARSRILV